MKEKRWGEDNFVLINHKKRMNEKETYETPKVEILEVKSEGIICASKDVNPSNPFSNPEWNW
jgi:hypothetical protein